VSSGARVAIDELVSFFSAMVLSWGGRWGGLRKSSQTWHESGNQDDIQVAGQHVIIIVL